MSLRDIQTEADIKTLVDKFYTKVIADPVIGYIFTDVVAFSWEKHLPVMYSFWSSILLGSGTYAGNPMEKHIALNKITELRQAHFDRWIMLWEANVNENFRGEKAIEAISRAKKIAVLMMHKIGEKPA